MVDLLHRDPPGHAQPDVFPGPTVTQQMPTGLVVGVDHNLLVCPLGRPQVEGHHVRQQFMVSDWQVSEVLGWGGRKILMRLVIIAANAGGVMLPSIRGRQLRET